MYMYVVIVASSLFPNVVKHLSAWGSHSLTICALYKPPPRLWYFQLNQQIDALTDPSPHGGLMRMNLVRPSQTRQQTIPYEITEQQQQQQQDSQHAMQLVRAQNKMLTKVCLHSSDLLHTLYTV